MGYLSIRNLYTDQRILMFKECYALQKVHGTSTHVSWNNGEINIFSGGMNHDSFKEIFDVQKLLEGFVGLGHERVTVYGEGYGGKQQGMSKTYGPDAKFVAFEVKIGDAWLDVPNAADVAEKLGLEFVYYEKINTDLTSIDAMRDRESEQAVRNGMGHGHKEEGVVLRPLTEMRDHRGNRVICKHKSDDFSEMKTPRKVDPEKLRVYAEARAVAFEFVTDMRMSHVLGAFPEDVGMESTGDVIKAYLADLHKEVEDEIAWSREVNKELSKGIAILFKHGFVDKLNKGGR